MNVNLRKKFGSIFIFISAIAIGFYLDYSAILGEQNMMAAIYLIAAFGIFLILFSMEDRFSLENISFILISVGFLIMSLSLTIATPPKALYWVLQGLFLLAATLLVFYNFWDTI